MLTKISFYYVVQIVGTEGNKFNSNRGVSPFVVIFI